MKSDENNKSDIKIGVIGGDLRHLVTACELAAEGYEVAVHGFDEYTGSLGMTTPGILAILAGMAVIGSILAWQIMARTLSR